MNHVVEGAKVEFFNPLVTD
jgi:RNA recognition motif-containing protein